MSPECSKRLSVYNQIIGHAANILQMPQFFAYEEYCAKYDIMIQTLSESNRTLPSWQYFESGIEALANSVIAIEDKPDEGKKGLTVGDLLIKVRLSQQISRQS